VITELSRLRSTEPSSQEGIGAAADGTRPAASILADQMVVFGVEELYRSSG
jgi:hypothetical protein